MASKLGVLGIFSYLDNLLAAIKSLRERQLKIETVYSPTARPEIQQAMGLRPSSVRYFTLCGGLLGATTGMGLASYAHLQWNFVTSGKPVLAWIPFVIVGFEFTILLGILFTLAGLLIQTRLPRVRIPNHYDPRFTQDRFGIVVSCGEAEREIVFKILKDAGAEEVHEVK